MKKLLSLTVMALLVASVLPMVMAAGIGKGFGGDVFVEDFPPVVWQCDDRVLTDDDVQPWRYTDDGDELYERAGNYLFEGEKYYVDVVVWDKNKIQDVVVDLILGSEPGDDDYTLNCVEISEVKNFADCNARMDEEVIDAYDPTTMQAFKCSITALDSEHMAGPYWLTVQADDGNEIGVYDEMTPLFINPMIELDVDGFLDFSDTRPGTSSYSQVVLENLAEGGVALDMFITGKNWPAADTDLGRCMGVDEYGTETGVLENYLPLGAFRYYAENGAYNTRKDALKDNAKYDASIVRNKDSEGYLGIHKQLNSGFEEAMFDEAEIIQAGGSVAGSKGYRANVLYPGSIMALTFRLDLPEPCYGEFESQEDGSIFIWAEAI